MPYGAMQPLCHRRAGNRHFATGPVQQVLPGARISFSAGSARRIRDGTAIAHAAVTSASVPLMRDLAELFAIHVPLWEIALRGTSIYFLLFALFRFLVPREMGAVGVADLLVLVLVADAAQNAMAGDYKTISEGAILICVIVGWNVAFDWLAFRFPRFARFAQPGPLRLVRDGAVLERNMARQLVTTDDLMTKLRQHGVDDVKKVKSAFLEPDGEISVILFSGHAEAPPKRAGGPAG
jgi:uncharacterized membrane protein YcaP (DUF421 family)